MTPPPPAPSPAHRFHLVSLTDAVPSLFGQVSITWNQKPDRAPAAAYMAPSQCHVPSFRSEREKADESEMCYILWEEAKWKQGNHKDQYGAESREPAGCTENTKQEASPLSCSLFSQYYFLLIFIIFFKALWLIMVLKSKEIHQIWKWHYWPWVTPLTISRQAHKSSRGIQ